MKKKFDPENFIDPLKRPMDRGYIGRDVPTPETLDFIRWSMKDFHRSKEEWENPDTYGCDRFFLLNFISPDMKMDFDYAARDFLKEEYESYFAGSKDRF